MAIWHHTKSTDENPGHDLCPSVADSRCGFQRDLANGTSTNHKHDHPIPEAVADAIHPTFQALSDERLLSRCLHGGTRNQNEAISGLIWQRATKETHSTLPTVELATFLVLAHFSDSTTALTCVLKPLGIVPGTHCQNACAELDHRRLSHSERKGTEEAKKRRKKLRNMKKGYSEILEEREGRSYGAGARKTHMSSGAIAVQFMGVVPLEFKEFSWNKLCNRNDAAHVFKLLCWNEKAPHPGNFYVGYMRNLTQL